MIKCVKLITGEELISETKGSLAGNTTILVDPIQLIVVPSRNNTSFNVAFTPFVPYAKEREFVIHNDNILFSVAPNDDLKNQYIRVTSGIVMASAEDLKILS